MPQEVSPPVTANSDTSEARAEPPWAPELPWLQPFPDDLLEPAAPGATRPDALAVSRETIELAFLLALQHLPPKQRAILILREFLGWSAQETAGMLDASVQSVNAALQRARSAMRTRGATLQHDLRRATPATDSERVLLQRFMDAWERKDAQALTALLRARVSWRSSL